MKKLLTALALTLTLAGCASPPPTPSYYQPSSLEQTTQRAKINQDLLDGRKRLLQLQQRLGRTTSPVEGAAIRADIEVQQYQIEVLEEQLASMPATGYSPAARSPCVTSTCGPVNVRGYYRKDGTYVRPHTRRRR